MSTSGWWGVSSLSTGHLSCRGHVLVDWWSLVVWPPHITVVVIVHEPFVLQRPHPRCYLVGGPCRPSPCCRCCHLQAICPVEALLLSLSSGGLIVVICGSFVLQRPRPHHCHCRSLRHCRCPVGASSLLVLVDRPCCIIILSPHWPSSLSHHLGGASSLLFMSFLSSLSSILEQLTMVACGGVMCLRGVVSSNLWYEQLTYLFSAGVAADNGDLDKNLWVWGHVTSKCNHVMSHITLHHHYGFLHLWNTERKKKVSPLQLHQENFKATLILIIKFKSK